MECLEEYIRESGRTFGEKLREHLRAPSSIYQHSQTTGHLVNVDCLTIGDREAHGFTRTINGAMFIQVNDPSLNRSKKVNVSPIPFTWDIGPCENMVSLTILVEVGLQALWPSKPHICSSHGHTTSDSEAQQDMA